MVAGHIYAKRTAWGGMGLRQAGTYSQPPHKRKEANWKCDLYYFGLPHGVKGQDRKSQTQKETRVNPKPRFLLDHQNEK